MTIILSSTDWDNLFEESAANGNLSCPTEHEIVLGYPEYLGNRYWQHVELPDDISIDIENHELCDRPDVTSRTHGFPEVLLFSLYS